MKNRIVNAFEGTLGETEKQELLTAIQGSDTAKSYLANRLINDKTVFIQLVESSCEQTDKDDFLDAIKGSLDESAKQALSEKIQTSQLSTLYLTNKVFADKPGLLEFRNAIKGTPEQADKAELLDKIQASTVENVAKDWLERVVNSWFAELSKGSAKVVNDAIYPQT
ncbi:hypothetical protein APSETT444_009347 [Aspergillus pseudonomiae]